MSEDNQSELGKGAVEAAEKIFASKKEELDRNKKVYSYFLNHLFGEPYETYPTLNYSQHPKIVLDESGGARTELAASSDMTKTLIPEEVGLTEEFTSLMYPGKKGLTVSSMRAFVIDNKGRQIVMKDKPPYIVVEGQLSEFINTLLHGKQKLPIIRTYMLGPNGMTTVTERWEENLIPNSRISNTEVPRDFWGKVYYKLTKKTLE